ncbi:DUF6088 family protein [Pseudomonas sichuanensis]|uniref:DUF6088 family protein n=1 Tax=Pseudomonas sichuanensis TaxID=2213015 RepID=UPI0035A6A847
MRIKRMRKGRPFHRGVLAHIGPSGSVTRVLSALVAAGLLERVARGIYVRPKYSVLLGRIPLSPIEFAKLEAKRRGQKLQIHGAEAVRRLGMSTQMSMIPIYNMSGPSREIRIANAVVQLRHVSPVRLQGAGSQAGLMLTAMHYLGRSEATTTTVSLMLSRLSDQDIRALQGFEMPKWMRNVLLLASEKR